MKHPSPYKEFNISASAVLTQRPRTKRLDRGLYDHLEPKMPRYGHRFIHRDRKPGLSCYYCKQPIYIVQDQPCRGRQ